LNLSDARTARFSLKLAQHVVNPQKRRPVRAAHAAPAPLRSSDGLWPDLGAHSYTAYRQAKRQPPRRKLGSGRDFVFFDHALYHIYRDMRHASEFTLVCYPLFRASYWLPNEERKEMLGFSIGMAAGASTITMMLMIFHVFAGTGCG
jgi:hypothetical protein